MNLLHRSPMSEVLLPPAFAPFTPQRLVNAFLDGLAPTTISAYRRDLEDFRKFVGAENLVAAAERLLTTGLGEANARVLTYRADLMRGGRAPATINRRLSSLRALVALARTVGLVPWRLEVKSLRTRPYRDSRGPERWGVEALLRAAEGQGGRKASRDVALVRLLYDLALRRGEVCQLDVGDVDRPGRRLFVIGKGQREKLPITLPDATLRTLQAWVAAPGETAGPLFLSFDPSGKGPAHGRLTGQGLWAI